jgi:hypothetical protein
MLFKIIIITLNLCLKDLILYTQQAKNQRQQKDWLHEMRKVNKKDYD